MKKQFTLFLTSLFLLIGCTQPVPSDEDAQDASEEYSYARGSCPDENNDDIWYAYIEEGKESDTYENYGWRNSLSNQIMIPAQYPMIFDTCFDTKKDKGFRAFLVGEGIWYRDTSGRKIIQLYTSNGPDDFSSGLARFVENEKIGFIDEGLNKVIPAQFDWASFFQDGEARVCNGCKLVSDGEHAIQEGGIWGTVNLKGEIQWID